MTASPRPARTLIGEYRQLFTADTRLEAVPDWFPDSADAWADADAVDFITDGERMAVLYSVTCSLPELSAGDLYRTHALAVFGSGGAEYAEWLAPVRPETYIFLPPAARRLPHRLAGRGIPSHPHRKEALT